MPTLNFSATNIKIFKSPKGMLDCSIRVFDRSIREYMDLFDTVDDITQKNLEGAPPPSFQGCSIIPSLPLSSNMQCCTACLKLDSDIQKSIRS